MHDIVKCAVCTKALLPEEEVDGTVCNECDSRSMKAILQERERKRKENPKLRRQKLRM